MDPQQCPAESSGVRRVPAPVEDDHLVVHWYLRFGVSYRDLEEFLATWLCVALGCHD
jgi:hypothetical protein